MLSSGFKETHRLLNELDNFRQNDHTLGQRLGVAGENDGLNNPPNAVRFINLYYNSLQGVYRRAKIQNFKNMLDFLIPNKVFGISELQRISGNNFSNDNDTVQLDDLSAAQSTSGKSKSIQERFKKHFNVSKLHNRYSKIPLLSQKLVSKVKPDNSNSKNSNATKEPALQHSAKKEQQQDANKEQFCPICLDLLLVGKSIIKELPCHHCYHVKCIEAWFFEYSNNNAAETLGGFNEMEFNCPYCRFDVYYYVLNNYDKNR